MFYPLFDDKSFRNFMLRQTIFIFTFLLLFNVAYGDTVGAPCCNQVDINNSIPDDIVLMIVHIMGSEKSDRYFEYAKTIIQDIKDYKEIFNEENDKLNMAFTFYLLRSFSKMDNIAFEADEIIAILNIVKDRYNFNIPEITFTIINQIETISINHDENGIKTIQLFNKDKQDISFNLSHLFDKESKVIITDFSIKNGTKIKFIDENIYKKNKLYTSVDSKIQNFFKRDPMLDGKETAMMQVEKEEALEFLEKAPQPSSNLPLDKMYVEIEGFNFKFIKNGKERSASIKDAVLVPGINGQKSDRYDNDNRPTCYVYLEDIPWGLFSFDLTVPL